MKPVDLHAPVTENLDLGGGYFLTSLAAPAIASAIQPGQFVMVGRVGIGELLLRRPFSVCLVRGAAGREELQILYRVVGKGTALFASLSRGAPLAVLGPLGCGFTDPENGERPVLVAGGVGIAAFPGFIERLARAGHRPALCYGGRTRQDLPLLDWLTERCDMFVTTDDGSFGERGLVTTPLRRILGSGRAHIYSCGPHPMLKAVAGIAEESGFPSDAAIEAPMACGFGVCLGCVVEAVNPAGEYGRFRRVCVEGPVFPTREIRW